MQDKALTEIPWLAPPISKPARPAMSVATAIVDSRACSDCLRLFRDPATGEVKREILPAHSPHDVASRTGVQARDHGAQDIREPIDPTRETENNSLYHELTALGILTGRADDGG